MFSLVAAVLVSASLVASEINLYPQAAVVMDVEEETGLITTVDENGELWQFFDDEWLPGDLCLMIMSDEGTLEIWDDVIISKKNAGSISNLF